MTNATYFEANDVSFSEVMDLYNIVIRNSKKRVSFDTFLKSEHCKCKFVKGDIIVLNLNKDTKSKGWNHCVVFEVFATSSLKSEYELRALTPHGQNPVGFRQKFHRDFVDKNFTLY